MKALITGASSGIGREIAKVLARQGYELIIVARDIRKLEELKQELSSPCEVYQADLSQQDACFKLYEHVKDYGVNILVNNAGFGLFGEFSATDLDEELKMIDLNIKAVHILTKLFLKDFIKADSGTILNVASVAAFSPGPLISGYYASKAYVLRLSEAIYEELRSHRSKVNISILCPGPVETEFNRRAGVNEGIKGLSSIYVAEYAIKMMHKRKLVIIPGFGIRLMNFGLRFISDKMLLRMVHSVQKRKKPFK